MRPPPPNNKNNQKPNLLLPLPLALPQEPLQKLLLLRPLYLIILTLANIKDVRPRRGPRARRILQLPLQILQRDPRVQPRRERRALPVDARPQHLYAVRELVDVGVELAAAGVDDPGLGGGRPRWGAVADGEAEELGERAQLEEVGRGGDAEGRGGVEVGEERGEGEDGVRGGAGERGVVEDADEGEAPAEFDEGGGAQGDGEGGVAAEGGGGDVGVEGAADVGALKGGC